MEEQKQPPVVLIRLNNGIELIGKIVSQEEISFFIQDPFQVGYRIGESTLTPTITLVRFMMLAESDAIELPNDQVLTTAIPRKSIVEYYHRACNVFRTEYAPAIDEESQSAIRDTSKEELYNTILEVMQLNRENMQ